MTLRPADFDAARQQRVEALIAFSKTTPVVAARPWGGTKAEEDPARCAQISALRCHEAQVVASVSAGNLRQDDLDEATVAPLLRWLTPHSAAWAMGRMATAVVRAARTKLSWSAHRGRGQDAVDPKLVQLDAVDPQLVELAHRGQPTAAPEARPEYPLKIWGGINDLMLWRQRRQWQKCPEYPLKTWGGIDDLMLRHRERTAGQRGCPDDRSMRQAAARTLWRAAQRR